MSKNLALQIKEKKDQQIKNFLRLVLPALIMMLVALFLLGKYINDNYSQAIIDYLHPSPTPTPTATQTLTPTATAIPTSTPTLTPTITLTPTPTPLPLTIIVNWQKIGVYELAATNSEFLSNGYLPVGKELEIVRYCSPFSQSYWALVRYPNKYGEFGWVFIDQTFKSLLVKNDRRPLIELLLHKSDLKINCPGKYTPVP